MSDGELNAELEKIKKIYPQLELYQGQEIKVLPLDIREELKKIRLLSPMTSAGLESINSVLKQLDDIEFVLENMLAGKSFIEKPIESSWQAGNQAPKSLPRGPQPKSTVALRQAQGKQNHDSIAKKIDNS